MVIPLARKITFLVGQNNSGKSSILRAIALLLNNSAGSIDADLDFSSTNKTVIFEFGISIRSLLPKFSALESFSRFLSGNSPDKQVPISAVLSKDRTTIGFSDRSFNGVLPERYLSGSSGEFLRDFGRAGDVHYNLEAISSKAQLQSYLCTTLYVPNSRLITNAGQETNHFAQSPFPGSQLTSGNILALLDRMSSPSGSNETRFVERTRFDALCRFMEFCLETRSVRFRVPHDKSTIYVEIDGVEHPISNLGSGIEQLLIIGVSAFGFSNALVLLEEPELHLHPRTQKRMVAYINENVEGRLLISTHSAAILDAVEADIVRVEQDSGVCKTKIVSAQKDRYDAIKDLGYTPSDLVQSNYVVWVEGPSDRIYVNHWIQKIDSTLVEGTDYSVLFYGGSVLAQHSFDDSDADLVKAISVCRQFTVLMDSDRSDESDPLRTRVERVKEEANRLNGGSWVTFGREVENYVPVSIIRKIKDDMGWVWVVIPASHFDRVLQPNGADKVKFARMATSMWNSEWPHDLKDRMIELVDQIRAAR